MTTHVTHATLADFITFTAYSLDEVQTAQVEMLLEQAAEQITSYLGTPDWSSPVDATGYTDGGNIARGRQVHMVRRYFDNQKGLTSESYDGISVGMDDRAYEGLRLTPYDKQVLDRTRKQGQKKIRTIPMHRNNGYIW